MFVFAAVIKLRYSQPDVPRAFRIPGGTTGVWIVGGVGFVATAFTFFVSTIPTGEMNVSVLGYMALMLFGTVLLALPPLVFMKMKKPGWKPVTPLTEEPAAAPEPNAAPAEQKEA